MEKLRTTPKDFFLWAGAMVALYASVFSFLSLFFQLVDQVFPDPLIGYRGTDEMLVSMAIMFVLFPTYLALMHFIREDIKANKYKKELWVRRWALTLTLFVAGASLAIDLIVLISHLLSGDLSQPFMLKAGTVLLMALAFFLHFLADIRSYWDTHRIGAIAVTTGTSVAVICALTAGFVIIGLPWQARLYRFDERKVSDLQEISRQAVGYWQLKGSLPVNTADLDDPIAGYNAPHDPQTGAVYEFNVTGPLSFKVCAEFNAETHMPSASQSVQYARPIGSDKFFSDMYHEAGYQCYPSSIDTKLYPRIQPIVENLPVGKIVSPMIKR